MSSAQPPLNRVRTGLGAPEGLSRVSPYAQSASGQHSAASDPSRCRSCRKPRRKRASGTAWEGSRGWCGPCTGRWWRAGKPDSGPPPPRPQGRHVLADTYDLAWRAGEPERRIARARPLAAALARCVAASDAEGVRLLLHRVTDWPALAVVLAECAEPCRTAVVCGMAPRRQAA